MFTLSSQSKQLFESGTVLEEWFSPVMQSLEKQRYSDAQFNALPMATYILSGCLRHLLELASLREYIQTLFHLKCNQEMLPIARSTWADALASKTRRDILLVAMTHLVGFSRKILPDRLAHIEGQGSREVIATDATYQDESAHFRPDYPMQGGVDNQKGHMLLSHYDVRHGIALLAIAETKSMGEMRVLMPAALVRSVSAETKAISCASSEGAPLRSTFGITYFFLFSIASFAFAFRWAKVNTAKESLQAKSRWKDAMILGVDEVEDVRLIHSELSGECGELPRLIEALIKKHKAVFLFLAKG